jgi:hypothetical protein
MSRKRQAERAVGAGTIGVGMARRGATMPPSRDMRGP